MRSLRFVHLAGDGTHLVLETPDGGEQFVLAADQQVRHAIGGAHRAPDPVADPAADPVATPPTASDALCGPAPAVPIATLVADPPADPIEITPREIQVRIRGGESPAELAASLGTSVERIARFAAPVVEERLRITDEARRARARRGGAPGNATGEVQLAVFGEIVDERFAAHGVAPSEVGWDSYRRDDGDWVVRAEWHRGELAYDARWVFHRTSRTVAPLDDPATDLLSDRPIRPVLPVEPQPTILSPGVVAFPVMPDALTGPLPVVEDVFDQDAGDRRDREAPSTWASASRLSDDWATVPVEFEEPPLPLGIVDPTTRPGAANAHRLTSVRTGDGKRQESDEERAARVKVPSWDDILLGVRRKQD